MQLTCIRVENFIQDIDHFQQWKRKIVHRVAFLEY